MDELWDKRQIIGEKKIAISELNGTYLRAPLLILDIQIEIQNMSDQGARLYKHVHVSELLRRFATQSWLILDSRCVFTSSNTWMCCLRTKGRN